MKENSPNKLIVGHLNINSIRNTFDFLEDVINRNLDIILLSETKLYNSFPSAQFILKGHGAPYRFDRNSKDDGLLFCICEVIPWKILKLRSDCNIESICVEINLRKSKWFINGSYNPSKSFLSNHLECFNGIIDEYSKKYQNFLFLGDFNAIANEKCMEDVCNLNGLASLIKKLTCFKNPDKPTCIDLILTNQPNCLQHSNVFEIGLSDFLLLTVTEFKKGFQKLPPKIVNSWDYKNFDNLKFRLDISKFDFDTSDLEGFKNTIFCIFNKHAPIKRKYVRANEAPFMTKELHKAIMKRSKLRNSS